MTVGVENIFFACLICFPSIHKYILSMLFNLDVIVLAVVCESPVKTRKRASFVESSG